MESLNQFLKTQENLIQDIHMHQIINEQLCQKHFIQLIFRVQKCAIYEVTTLPNTDSKFNIVSFTQYANNVSCWYSTIRTNIQIKTAYTPPANKATKVADTVNFTPYDVCQKINLYANCTYTLKFDAFTDYALKTCSISINFNGTQKYIKNYTTSSTIFTEIYTFTVNSTGLMEICFNAINLVYISSTVAFRDPTIAWGIMLDNVTLNWISGSNTTSNTNTTTNSNNTTTTVNTTTTNTTNGTTTNNAVTNNTTNATISSNITTNSTINSSTNISNNTNNNTFSNNNNTINNSNSNNNIAITPIYNNISSLLIVINFISHADSKRNILIIDSNLTLSQFPGLTLDYFYGCDVIIQDTSEINLQYSVDFNGRLMITSVPDMLYDRKSLQNMKIIFPPALSALASLYTFKIIIDGQQINYQISNDTNLINIKKIIPLTTKIATKIRQIFTIMNAIGCSYFLISLIGFCNLTLLYYFLHINMVPNFARMFIFSLLYIFVSRGSIQDSLNKFDWFRNNVNLDFSTFQIIEKMPSTVGDNLQWFSYFTVSTNFLQSNFEPVLLLSFLIIKFLLLKLIIKILPKKIEHWLDVSWQKFYHHFVIQFSCFLPYLVISALTNIFDLGQITFIGLINNSVQILAFFAIIMLAIVSLSLNLLQKYNPDQMAQIKTNKILLAILSSKKIKQQQIQKQHSKRVKSIERYSYLLMCFSIPTFITLFNPLLFFVMITPLIYWRFFYFFKNSKLYSLLDRTIKFLSHLSWLVYHSSFIAIFIINQFNVNDIKSDNSSVKNKACNFFGYVVIFCILFGSIVDITEAVIRIIEIMYYLIKKLIRRFWHNQKQQNKQKETSLVKPQKHHRLYRSRRQTLKIILQRINVNNKNINNIKTDKRVKIKRAKQDNPCKTGKKLCIINNASNLQFSNNLVKRSPSINNIRAHL